MKYFILWIYLASCDWTALAAYPSLEQCRNYVRYFYETARIGEHKSMMCLPEGTPPRLKEARAS